jgi:hypothetical protein
MLPAQCRARVVELIFGLIYGVLLEWMTLRQLQAYEYGQFLVMFDGAPLAIGLGWAVIIYSSMEFSSRLQMPALARPFLDGLLALNIDLAMDTIAIRMKMWTWGVLPLDQEWFGVPWGNFWAWFIVVTSFSAFLRIFRAASSYRLWRIVYVPFAFMLSIVVLFITNRLFAIVLHPNDLGFAGMALLIGCGLVIVLTARPRVGGGPLDPVVLAVPLVFHVFFIVCGLYFGFYAQLPILAVIGVGMALIGMALHLWPWWANRRKPTPAA